jgi:ActR/RegA family two-component response regulator
MFWNIEKIKCLIVEDDQFKMEGIRSYLTDIFKNRIEMSECQALASATALLASQEFHLAIIDMSIHSHEPEAGAGSPFPLSSGGLDVLFEIVYTQNKTHCIILTQYPDIDIDSLPIPVDLAKQEILDKFDIEVAGCVRYLENDNKWKENITLILEQL